MGKRRPPPSNRGINRRAPSKEPKVRIIAVCEGGNTEPQYLVEFARFYGNSLVSLQVVGGAGDPKAIVNKAVEAKNNQKKIARRSKDSFEKNFQIWAVFDVDEHRWIPAATNKAQANGIQIAISNPCIEIWGVFHYETHTAHIHRHDAQRKLKSIMPDFDHDKGSRFNFEDIKEKYQFAKDNAIHVEKRHTSGGSPANSNPSSNMYKLLDEIIKYGKEES